MKTELAIEILKELWRYEHTDKYTEAEMRQALDMAINMLSEHLDAENNYNSAKINDKMQDSAIKVDLISRADLLNETVNKNSIWNKITDAKGRNLEEIIAELPTHSAEQTDLLNILIKEYLSKCECCDECFAEYFCIKNYLRESREPKDYCIENIKQYLSVRNSIDKVDQTYGWRKGCKEYDQESHCCHRYSSFIRETLQDNINAVLEDIKEEMEKEQDECPYPLDIEHAIAIIEKHISGKE